MSSPTRRTLELVRKLGYQVDVVERYNSFVKRRFDFVGCIDLIAFSLDDTVGIQATSSSNRVSRLEKLLSNENAKLWASAPHRKLWLVTWGKRKKGNRSLWTERIDEIRVEDFHV